MQKCVCTLCKTHVRDTSDLMQRINDTRASISQNVEAVGQWRKQLCAFVKANGNHFKHLLNKNGSFQSQHTIHNRLFSEPPTVYRCFASFLSQLFKSK